MAGSFLKWAGGKARLARRISEALPAGVARYHEPFLGGGAVFFALQQAGQTPWARLSDTNGELVECFGVVRDRPDDLTESLAVHSEAYLPGSHEARTAYFLAQRACRPADAVARAARLIFLNRTCYNGLYRVNASGQFNVPHGRYANPRIVDREGIGAASVALRCTELSTDDFGTACERARPGDFVYLDPPYYPLSATSNFTDYTSGAFGPAEHERLRDAFEALTRRGVHAMLSNSKAPFVEALYAGHGYRVAEVTMSRAINSVGAKRAPIAELLVDNFERVGRAPGL